MKQIFLTRGHVALIDDQDFEITRNYKWRADIRPSGVYVKAFVRGDDGKMKPIYLHRLILGVTGRWNLVDHKDGNPLNNTRENLRRCEHLFQNGANKRRAGGEQYQFKGLTPRANGRWGVRIKHMGRGKNLGIYDTPEDAARAYDQKAKELFGEFANLNFPNK